MRGKKVFTMDQAYTIGMAVAEKERSDRAQQKTLRQTMRDEGFYISDFGRFPGGFTHGDWLRLIEQGKIQLRPGR